MSSDQITELFLHLEGECGGDGNGIVTFAEGESVLTKGVDLEVDECAQLALTAIQNKGYAIWHTRKISVGWSADGQCHPFRADGRGWKGYLAHNGTWSSGAVLAEYLRVGSDTAALARCLGKFGLAKCEERGLFPSSGVFLLGGDDGDCRAIKRSGDLQFDPETGIVASSFPARGYPLAWDVATGSHRLGKPMPKEAARKSAWTAEDAKRWGFLEKRDRAASRTDTFTSWIPTRLPENRRLIGDD